MTSPAEGGDRPVNATTSGPGSKVPCLDDTTPRLEWLICWYERQAWRENLAHKSLRIASIAAAAAIPILAAAQAQQAIGALLGGTVVALEAVQELFQFQRNYVSFATTKEALKRERALFRASAGPYRSSRTRDAGRLLAERIEALVAVETAGWAEIQDTDQKKS